MKKINKVTVTGADDSVDISKLFEIQTKYPFVEFGILLSSKYSLGEGRSRFPSKKWLTELFKAQKENKQKLYLSGHICGKWVTEILKGNLPDNDEVNETIDFLFNKDFRRYQLNTHAELHKVDFEKLSAILMNFLNVLPPKIVIFQLDGVNEILPHFIKQGTTLNVHGLFDLSHGAGVLPDKWPDSGTDDVLYGYAGGLSPSNVKEQIEKIIPVTKKNFWIDAETHLRSDGDRKFDLDKVIEFLENSKPYIDVYP